MRRFSMRIIIVVTTIVLGASLWGLAHLYQGTRGKVLDRWETTNATFRVRVTAYKENVLIVPGTYYVFQSAPVRSEVWQEIMTLKFDGPAQIPREQVRFVDDRVAYAFMGETYSVTTDGGHTWTLWNSEAALRNQPDVVSRSIKMVSIRADGTGTMQLYEHPYQKGATPTLRTEDYGRHWSLD